MNAAFEEANKKVHTVESEWHYKYMIAAGFVAETKEQTGFVRQYKYMHPTLPNIITANTGASADYWNDDTARARGYWADLGPYVTKLTENLAAK